MSTESRSIDQILSVSSPQTCSNQTQILPDGGYLKVQGDYYLYVDVVTTNGGRCDRLLDGQPYDSKDHGVVKDWYWGYYTSPDFPITFFAPGPYPLNYDTRSPNGGNPTYADNGLYQLGTYHLQFQTVSDPTECSFPTMSNIVNRTINVVACEPQWMTNAYGNYGHQAPPTPPNKVQVYLDSTLSSASTALSNAINDWNSHIASTGVAFDKVTSPCSGSSCVVVQSVAGLPSGSCGFTPPMATNIDGSFTSTTYLQLDNTWGTWSTASLQRTFAHELGHHLGLLGYSSTSACDTTGNTAIMQLNFHCSPTDTPLTAVSANDYLPITSTVYGGHSTVVCGF